MLKERYLHNRSDRMVALGRTVLAAAASLATRIDPLTSAGYSSLVGPVLNLYLGLATSFALLVWIRSLTSYPLGTWAHLVDLAVIAVLIYSTAGASSPFFPLFLFTILAATVRWGWRGSLWTTAAVMALFMPTAIIGSVTPDPARDDLARYIIRVAQVPVIGALLAYFGAHRERVSDELARVSRTVDPNGAVFINEWIRACLIHARSFYGADRVIFAWTPRDETRLLAVELDGAGLRDLVIVPTSVDALVHGVREGAFDFDARSSLVRLYRDDGSLSVLAESPLDHDTSVSWGMGEGIASSVHCDALDGWLFVAKRPRDEDLYLARALCSQLTSALDHAAAAEAWRATTASEERVRLARDLHDGILQFLAGLSLQLKLIQQEAVGNPASVAERVTMLQKSLRAEQQDLRSFVEGLRPRSAPQPGTTTRLQSLCQLLSHQWDVDFAATIVDEPPPGIAADIRQIVREATANAVRHGHARKIRLSARRESECYMIELEDDGGGIGRDGSFGIAELRSASAGPRTVIDRVERLGGSLRLQSSPDGTLLSIAIPSEV